MRVTVAESAPASPTATSTGAAVEAVRRTPARACWRMSRPPAPRAGRTISATRRGTSSGASSARPRMASAAAANASGSCASGSASTSSRVSAAAPATAGRPKSQRPSGHHAAVDRGVAQRLRGPHACGAAGREPGPAQADDEHEPGADRHRQRVRRDRQRLRREPLGDDPAPEQRSAGQARERAGDPAREAEQRRFAHHEPPHLSRRGPDRAQQPELASPQRDRERERRSDHEHRHEGERHPHQAEQHARRRGRVARRIRLRGGPRGAGQHHRATADRLPHRGRGGPRPDGQRLDPRRQPRRFGVAEEQPTVDPPDDPQPAQGDPRSGGEVDAARRSPPGPLAGGRRAGVRRGGPTRGGR